MSIQLCPAQQKAFERILNVLPLLPVVGLTGASGAGKTTVLQKVREHTGGEWLSMRSAACVRPCHPLAIEETFEQLVTTALAGADYVFLDDLSLLTSVVSGGCGSYPRPDFLATALESITSLAEASQKKLIFAAEYSHHNLEKKGLVDGIHPSSRPITNSSAGLTSARTWRPGWISARFIATHSLGGYDLKTVGIMLRGERELTTDGYIEALRSFGLTSNVRLGEVQQVTLADLKGVDDVIQSLETNVILALEQIELAEELGLKPKRGVLLAGPPGTGKTTVGRVPIA